MLLHCRAVVIRVLTRAAAITHFVPNNLLSTKPRMLVVLNGMLGMYIGRIAPCNGNDTDEHRCAQLFIYSTGGNTSPGNTVSIPGYVSAQHPGVIYNWWLKKGADYKLPGPEPEPCTKSSNGGDTPIKVPFTPHRYGECVVKNANWCAVSPPEYSNEASCWEVSTSFNSFIAGIANRVNRLPRIAGRSLKLASPRPLSQVLKVVRNGRRGASTIW